MIKTHILLTAPLPLLVKVCGVAITSGEKAQLANGVAEAIDVIHQLLNFRVR